MRLNKSGLIPAIIMVFTYLVAAAPPASRDDRVLVDPIDRALPEVAFDAVGFGDTIDFLRDVSGANIFVNWKALEAAGVNKETPVTLKLRNTKFHRALQLILDSIGAARGKLSFETRDGVIVISTAENLKKDTIRKNYDIRFLVPGSLNAPSRDKRVAAIVKLVKGSIDPASWKDYPASCAISELKGELTVSQTAENHKQVENLIDQLRELMALTKSQ